MDSGMEKYLRPTFFIDCQNPLIKAKSFELTASGKTEIEKAVSIFYFVRDAIRYNIYLPKSKREYFMASDTLSKREGYCVQKAVLLAALARAAGIPAGLGFARLKNYLLPESLKNWLGTDILPFHGYTRLYLDGKWVKVTPAFDLKLCEKNGFLPVEFDGTTDASFSAANKEGKLHIEYLADLGYSDDLPIERLWAVLREALGDKYLDPPPRNA